MNERNNTSTNKHCWTKAACHSALAACLAAILTPAAATDFTEWQLRRLFNPSHSEQQNEHDGRIFIYDGLTDKVVQRAVDERFDRVDYMMFTGTIVTDEGGEALHNEQSGEVVKEDDGC